MNLLNETNRDDLSTCLNKLDQVDFNKSVRFYKF